MFSWFSGCLFSRLVKGFAGGAGGCSRGFPVVFSLGWSKVFLLEGALRTFFHLGV